MAREQYNRRFVPHTPADTVDPPRFSQPVETVKDVLVQELRNFIENARLTSDRREELPTVEKYATFPSTEDPFATVAQVVRKLPEKPEALPHIAVLATSGAERKLTIGPPYVALVQDPPRLIAATAEPYALEDGDVLVIRTLPNGRSEYLDKITFTSGRFPTANPITAALAQDVANEINQLAHHCLASVVAIGGDNYLQIEAGGPLSKDKTPTEIEVHYTTSANVLDATGLGRTGDVTDIDASSLPDVEMTAPAGTWSASDVDRYVQIADAELGYFNNGRFLITGFATAGGTDTLTIESKYGRSEVASPATFFIGLRDTDRNTARPPLHRYAMAWDLAVQVAVLTEDDNTRGELADLVSGFFGFFLEQQLFSFYGRTGFSGQTTAGEHYNITIHPPFRSSAEAEYPRLGDSTGKVYANSFSLDVTIVQYLDRQAYAPGTSTPFFVDSDDLNHDETLPLNNQLAE